MFNTAKENFNFFGLIFIRFVLANLLLFQIKSIDPFNVQNNEGSRANKYFFPNHMSAIALFYRCGMAEFCITEYSGFIYKKKHSSYQCLLVGDRSVSIHNGNLEFPATE